MGVNQFLAFGTGGGANVIDQVTYSGLAARTSGFSSGTAQSAQLNKVWRQSSIIAAMIGQLIADYSGSDANDDGDIPTLEARLIAGMRGALQSSISGVVGQTRNLSMVVGSASATANLTADEIIVESSLGGARYCLSSFNQSINLASTGAGGMDIGSAPVNGYVALFAIYNPTTNARALLASNATSAAAPSVYGGANMPSGYTSSALIAVVPTNASSQFVPCIIAGRRLSRAFTAVLTASSTIVGTFTSLSIASAVPMNAKRVSGYCEYTNSIGANLGMYVASSSGGVGQVRTAGVITTNGQPIDIPFTVDLQTAQILYYSSSVSSGAPSFSIAISS